MSPPDQKFDSRQPNRDRPRQQVIPGELRLHHLDGAQENYLLKKWLVRPGDSVKELQTVAIVETASFLLDIEAYDTGIISEQCFTEGQVIPNGAIIARIELLKDSDS